MEDVSMDAADRAILMALTKNARTPIKQLAQEAYLSSPAASARLERCYRENVKDWNAMKTAVRDALRSFIYEKTQRSPVILPIFLEV